MIRKPVLATVVLLVSLADRSHGADLISVYLSPDIAIQVDGLTVEDEHVVFDSPLRAWNAVNLGEIPAGAAVDAFHRVSESIVYFSTDTTIEIGGGVYQPGDVVQWNGQSHSMVFDIEGQGFPPGTNVDAVSAAGSSLLLSFDTTVALPGPSPATADDEDLVQFDGGSFSLYFDGSEAGVAPTLDLDGVAEQPDGSLLLSFDGSGVAASVSFDDEDVLLFEPQNHRWQLVYDASARSPEWAGADVEALDGRMSASVSVWPAVSQLAVVLLLLTGVIGARIVFKQRRLPVAAASQPRAKKAPATF